MRRATGETRMIRVSRATADTLAAVALLRGESMTVTGDKLLSTALKNVTSFIDADGWRRLTRAVAKRRKKRQANRPAKPHGEES